MDRVGVAVTDGIVIFDVDTVVAAKARSRTFDAAKGPSCGRRSDDPRLFLPQPIP